PAPGTHDLLASTPADTTPGTSDPGAPERDGATPGATPSTREALLEQAIDLVLPLLGALGEGEDALTTELIDLADTLVATLFPPTRWTGGWPSRRACPPRPGRRRPGPAYSGPGERANSCADRGRFPRIGEDDAAQPAVARQRKHQDRGGRQRLRGREHRRHAGGRAGRRHGLGR